MKGLRKFLSLSPTDRGLLLKSVSLLLLIKLGLWLLSLESLCSLLTKLKQPLNELQKRNEATIERIAWAVGVASQWVPGTRSCLFQALAGLVLLERRGFPARLRIGIARGKDGRWEGDAWLESQGRTVVGGLGIELYSPLSAFENPP